MPDLTFGAASLQPPGFVAAGLVKCRPDETQRFYRARPSGRLFIRYPDGTEAAGGGSN